MISRNLLYTLFCYGFIGIYGDLQILIFSMLPGPLADIYNHTLVAHYKINPTDSSLAIMSSLMSFGPGIGMIFSVLVLLPLMDKFGRKFLTVKVRLVLGASCSVFQILAGILESAEFYLLAQFLVGASLPIMMMATQLYVTECSPDSKRGTVATALIAGNIFGSMLMFLLCKPSFFGTTERWPIIPFISLIMSVLLFLLSFRIPDSPKWLLKKGRKEEARTSIWFFHGSDSDVENTMDSIMKEINLSTVERISPNQLRKDDTLREALIITIAIMLFLSLGTTQLEGMYTVVLHTRMGLTVEQSMMLNLVVHLVFAPVRFCGTMLIDRFGRRPVVFFAAAVSYIKISSLCFGTFLTTFAAPNIVTIIIVIVNEILSEIYAASGIGAMGSLMIAELFPPAARISAAQLTMFVPMLCGFPLVMMFPVISSLFAPAYFIPLLIGQPLVVSYLYRHLPETKSRSVYDIVHDLNIEVRSRANTRRYSILSESSVLMQNQNPKNYMAI